jgi:hypothetical protein
MQDILDRAYAAPERVIARLRALYDTDVVK